MSDTADPLSDHAIRVRFWSKVDVSGGPDACWPWTQKEKPNGYGVFHARWKPRARYYAHRAAHVIFKGPIPEGHDVDHECHNRDPSCRGGPTCPHRACVNPRHLRTATRSVNLRAGRGTRGRRLPPKTHCKYGHEFTEANTWIHAATGARRCRACNNRRQKETQARKRAGR